MMARIKRMFARSPAAPLRRAGGAAALALIALSAASCTDITGSERDLQILWPREGATLRDEELLQVRLRGRDLDDYEVFWSVDGGREELMWNEWDDGTPYKGYIVDTWYWDWNGGGPYEVTFLATDFSGREIARRRVRVYVE
jgi:hypothetical protein